VIRGLRRSGCRLDHVVAGVRIALTDLYRSAYVYRVAEHSALLGEALFALTPVAVRRRGRELGLTAVSTLATLERTGQRRLTDLAMNEGVTQPSMTAVVTQLEDLAFAERRRDPADLRVVLVAITRSGRQNLRTMRRTGASVFTALIDKLAAHEVAALGAALPALRHLVELAAEGQDGHGGPPSLIAVPGSRLGRASQPELAKAFVRRR
jgi:DNA-binding MarR family transcriptional regulator